MADGMPPPLAPPAAAETPLRSYTVEEVAAHKTRDDCWIAVGGRVYDVTRFLTKHPGGSGIILRYAGKECTTEFEGFHHSARSRTLLTEHCAGSDASLAPHTFESEGSLLHRDTTPPKAPSTMFPQRPE